MNEMTRISGNDVSPEGTFLSYHYSPLSFIQRKVSLIEAERPESIRDHKSYRNKPNLKRKKKTEQKISRSRKTRRKTPLRAWAKALTQRKISPRTTLISHFIVNQSVGGLMGIDEEKKIPANVK